MKVCVECGYLMPAAARKCTKCESYQDWRGRISFNATVISMLTALAATLITAVPVARRALTTADSKIHATYSDSEAGGFRLIITNAGDRPGVVQGGRITFPGKTWEQSVGFDPEGRKGVLIKAGTAREITFNVSDYNQDLAKLPETLWNSDKCEIELHVVSFRGINELYGLYIPCWIPLSVVKAHVEMNPLDHDKYSTMGQNFPPGTSKPDNSAQP